MFHFMSEPVRASTVFLSVGIIFFFLGVFILGRPDTWIDPGLGAGLMIVGGVILIIVGVLLRYGRAYFYQRDLT